MIFSELTKAISSYSDSSFINFIKSNNNELKLLFLNADDDLETQNSVIECFLVLYQYCQSNLSLKSTDEFQGLINQFALYFKRVNRLAYVQKCKHLSVHPSFINRIDAYIFTGQYNSVSQHISRFQEYLNCISKALYFEETDFVSDVANDIADYYLYGKKQLELFGEAARLHEFELLFEDDGLIKSYPVLAEALIKIHNKYISLPVHTLVRKVYEPSEFTEKLFESKIINPIKYHPNTRWHNILLGYTINEIRFDIIQKGQADFDRKHKGLSSKEVVALYCYFNMRKHYFTSLSIFERLDNLVNIYETQKRIKFIDIGCGPGTSGIAFIDLLYNTAKKPVLIDYFGIDIAASMRETAKDYLENDAIDTSSSITILSDVEGLDLDAIRDTSLILINTCYLFASLSLDISRLADFVNRVRTSNRRALKYLVFQNPYDDSKNKSYFQFKAFLGSFKIEYSNVDVVYYNNKRSSPFAPTSEQVFYEILKL